MALRNIITQENELLRKISKPVTEFNERLWQLLDDMRETMIKGDGVGLAAPQVGILKRVVIVDIHGMFLELINPEIVSSKGNQCKVEGCLSVKGVSGYVNRPNTVTVKAFDRMGKEFTITGTDLLAICLCHEIDHLNGRLFIDIMTEEYSPKKSTKKEQ